MERNRPQDTDDIPLDDQMSKERGEEARKHLEDVPPAGTDPLHEGP